MFTDFSRPAQLSRFSRKILILGAIGIWVLGLSADPQWRHGALASGGSDDDQRSGNPRPTHDEFGGRVISEQGSTTDHGTQVGDTILASGFDTAARGMAPAAGPLHSYTSEPVDDTPGEMVDAVNDHAIVLSNNSWGLLIGWDGSGGTDGNTGLFGDHTSRSDDWDSVVSATGLVINKAAGNHSGECDPNPPNACDGINIGGQQYYNIGPLGVAKNIITVGAVNSDVGPPNDITGFSSAGPTDDGRIKPDIVADGWSLYSSCFANDSDYCGKSGTSMSTPTTTGSTALLFEHYRNRYGGADPSVEIVKALLVNSADERGPAGPDYVYGHGALNTLAAAEPPAAADTGAALTRQPEIRVEAERLWATFHETPIEQAIRAIGAQAPFSAVFEEGLTGSVSGRFQGVPLLEALNRLLDGASWVARFDRGGGIIALHVYSVPDAEPGQDPTAGAGPADEASDNLPLENQPMSETRRAGLEAIMKLGAEQPKHVSDTLVTALETHEDPVVRWNAAAALASASDGFSGDVLAMTLVDSTEARDVRRLAAWALGRREDRTGLWALRAAARDPDEIVREAAQNALELIRNDGVHPKSRPGRGRTTP